MARMRSRRSIVAGVVVLAAIVVAVLVRNGSERGGYRLPVGKGTPMISLGETHGLILASDGSLWSWGSESLGSPRLGLGTATYWRSLRRIGNETNWTYISAGRIHDLAVKSDGTLWAWGLSPGRPPNNGPADLLGTPVLAAPGDDWKQAAAGGSCFGAVKRDGTLWMWRELGYESTNGTSRPVQLGSASNWVKVWVRGIEMAAMQSDGSLWEWETPVSTQTGREDPAPTPTRINGDTGWMDAALAKGAVLAIKPDGTLWAWGESADLYTGGDRAQNTTPARVGTDSDWKSICVGYGLWSRGLIKKDGSLWVMEKTDDKTQDSQSFHGLAHFQPAKFLGNAAAYAGDEIHPFPYVNWTEAIGVALTRDGEVWTWGVVLGNPPPRIARLTLLAAKCAGFLHLHLFSTYFQPEVHDEPWRLRVIEPEGRTKQ